MFAIIKHIVKGVEMEELKLIPNKKLTDIQKDKTNSNTQKFSILISKYFETNLLNFKNMN